MAVRYVVLAVVEDDDGNMAVNHVATCLHAEEAAHLTTMIEGSGVIEVGDDEWVNPAYAEIATPEA